MFFADIKEDDIRTGSGITLYDKGEYVVSIDKLEVRFSQKSQAQMINVRFGVVARLEKADGITMASPISGSPIWNNFVFVGGNGKPNKVGSSMFMQLLSGVTGETKLDVLKERFDGEGLEDVAEKASMVETLKCVAFIGQRNERDRNGESVVRNSVGSFKPMTNVEEDAIEESMPENNGQDKSGGKPPF